jgi:6-phosphogluconolactonase
MTYLTSGYGTGQTPTILLLRGDDILWSSNIPNPSYLCKTDDLLFAVGEFDDHCTITSFKKEGSAYAQKDCIQLEGTCLCHLSAHPDAHFLAASCWGNGLFFTVAYHEDGTFGDILYKEYQSDDTGRKSRVHCALIDEDWIYVVNIELDLIFCYHLENGIPAEYSRLSLPTGTGPRHICLNKENQLIYCVTEYSSQLLTIDCSNRMNMKLLSAVSLLDPSFEGTSYGSTLAVTKDQQHIYCANRGENTIAHFTINDQGLPIFSDRTSCLGDWPRHIALLENDSLLAIANQNSGEIVFLSRDSQNGKLAQKSDRKITLTGASFVSAL